MQKLVVSIVAPDGYEFASEVDADKLDRYLDLVLSVLRPGEGVMIRGI